MKLISSLAQLTQISTPIHIAFGIFDGLHIGHQVVINQAVNQAKKKGGISAVLTFTPHPIQIISPDKAPSRILASIEHKQLLLESFGVDILIVLPFTKELLEQTAEDFITSIVQVTQLKSVCIGKDWRFGFERRGNYQLLQNLGASYGFKVFNASLVEYKGQRISSTFIRQLIEKGELEEVKYLLGRNFSVFCEVVHGEKRGEQLEAKTANCRVVHEQLPPEGVYFTEVNYQEKRYPSISNLGKKLTFHPNSNESSLEVHLLDFQADLYGASLEVVFLKYLRAEEKFDNLEGLKQQIKEDIEQARTYFSL